MKQHYAEMAVLISIIPLGMYITDTLMTMYPNISFLACLLYSALLGLLVLMAVFIIYINLGDLVKALYFKMHGYSLFPLVLYPLYFRKDIKNKKIHICFSFDWTAAFRDLYPAVLSVNININPLTQQEPSFAKKL